LAALAVNHFVNTARPLRLAIDTSIWLFQIQSSKGGTNPALRTFYYRLLRMIALNIHPLFVFDGPNKPPFQRNKRTGPNVASVPEFLAKQLLKHFAFPMHMAPGEAEAECAFLQREGLVDAVLSEDVDTLMFGSKQTIRNWSAQDKGKSPTHVNLYNADETKVTSGLDREGMILVALMSGGDYVPEGIPGCGPKIACEAARAGFGRDLCNISRSNKEALQAWRNRLSHELKTNESKFFKSKHGSIKIPDDFPNRDILGYYTHPAISTIENVQQLRQKFDDAWDKPLNFPELRDFTADAFDWRNFTGAKKFVRNLAQSLLFRELRRTPDSGYVQQIHQLRNHASIDGLPELRVSYTPIEVVNIDLDSEPPDDTFQVQADEEEEGLEGDEEIPASTQAAKSRPFLYDPSQVERIWVPQVFVEKGASEKYIQWANRATKTTKVAKATGAASGIPGARRGYKTKTSESNNAEGLNAFVSVSKTGLTTSTGSNLSQKPTYSQASDFRIPPLRPTTPPMELISLVDSSAPPTPAIRSLLVQEDEDGTPMSPNITTRRRKRSPLRRVNTHASDMSIDQFFASTNPSPARSTRVENTPKRPKGGSKGSKKSTRKGNVDRTELFSSPAKSSIVNYFSQETRDRNVAAIQSKTDTSCVDLTELTPPKRSFTRTRSVPVSVTELNAVDEDDEDLPNDMGTPTPRRKYKDPETIDLTLSSPMKPLPFRCSQSNSFRQNQNPIPKLPKPLLFDIGNEENSLKRSKMWLKMDKKFPGTFRLEESSPKPHEKSTSRKLSEIKILDLR
jgi:Holliday junction resolvase YEN1